MKRLLNSSSLLIGLILVRRLLGMKIHTQNAPLFIGVLGNRQKINGAIDGAIANVLFKDNYAQQWRREASSSSSLN